jgi:hypothetical protein
MVSSLYESTSAKSAGGTPSSISFFDRYHSDVHPAEEASTGVETTRREAEG